MDDRLPVTGAADDPGTSCKGDAAMTPRLLRIAVLAMGGEGGGVLADWLVDLAEHAGHVAQTTSVPGVAQRTGATIYYVEMLLGAGIDARPVMALMPLPGDVDIVIASELMEAARAVQRGLVTPGAHGARRLDPPRVRDRRKDGDG